VIVYAVVDIALSPDFPLGVELEVFIRREDAERFIAEVRGDDPEIAAMLRTDERELDEGELNELLTRSRPRARRCRSAPRLSERESRLLLA
jgi:hypothetical protein